MSGTSAIAPLREFVAAFGRLLDSGAEEPRILSDSGAVRRHTYPIEGGRKPFVPGYSNTLLPNLWDRSAEPRKPDPA